MPVDKKNIFLSGTIEPLPFSSRSSRGADSAIPSRIIVQHANYLKRRFEEAYANNNIQSQQVAAIRYKEGIYLEFAGQQNHDLVVKSLENIRDGIRLLNVRTDADSDTIKATVYVPEGKESYFINRLEKYLSEVTDKGEPRHKDLFNSVEDVKLAFLDAFWVGDKNYMPMDTSVWCEIWLRVDSDQYDKTESSFVVMCKETQILYDEKSIRFPERLVKLVSANAAQLGEIIKRYGFIAEIRRAQEVTSFFNELSSNEQKEWVDDLLSRIEYDLTDSSVCILDTGVNTGHPLLENSFHDDCVQAVDASWGGGDHYGHGTKMAGIALFHDLKERLISSRTEKIFHHLESVKILPPSGENDPKLYGAITQDAVYLAEIVRPQFDRAVCMAVTSDRYNTNDGSPTSWSGAVDSLVSGAVSDNIRRLFFVSAGNVYPHELASLVFG